MFFLFCFYLNSNFKNYDDAFCCLFVNCIFNLHILSIGVASSVTYKLFSLFYEFLTYKDFAFFLLRYSLNCLSFAVDLISPRAAVVFVEGVILIINSSRQPFNRCYIGALLFRFTF